MAEELGASPKTARRAALLHDIGKAVTHEIEGPHALVGGELARKYGEPEAVAHAMEAHHNEVEPQTIEAVIVQAADALSGARPGARGESLEQYVKRLRDLEQHRHASQGRRQGLRDAGRARDPGDGRPGRDRRRRRDAALLRDRPRDREGARVSRADQGHGDPGVARGRVRALSANSPKSPADRATPVQRTSSGKRTLRVALAGGGGLGPWPPRKGPDE